MNDRKLRVFIVDDEKLIRDGLRKLLHWEELGFSICGEAANGRDALPAILELQPDIVLTDLKMPFMDGIALAENLADKASEILVIVLTGFDEFHYAKAAVHAGVFEFLLKPAAPDELKSALLRAKEKILSRGYSYPFAQNAALTAAIQDMDESAAFAALNRIFKDLSKEYPESPSSSDILVEKLKLYLKSHHHENITLKMLEDEFFFNASYISRIFKSKTGENYSDYLLRIRIEHAKELLANTNRSIIQISEMAGFGSSKYFSRIFKSVTGMSPVEYRREHQSSHR